MLEVLVGNILFRMLPTRLAIGALKRLGIDVRTTWERERLYFLNSNFSLIAKRILLVFYYWVSPIGRGVAWGCAMESSFRVISLALFYKRIDASISKEFVLRKIKIEKEFIENNLETHSFNNHYLFNVAALFVACSLLSLESESTKWEDELLNTVLAQFNPDGTNFEASTAYHFLVMELLASVIHIVPEIMPKLIRTFNYKGAIDFAHACMFCPTDIWLIGDNDSSSCVPFEDKLADQRQYQYERMCDEFGYYPKNRLYSQIFNNFGACFLNCHEFNFALWNPQIGQGGKGGHNHNDCLSISLAVAGRAFIIDPGVFKYSDKRDEFRSAAYHSLPRPIDFEHERFLNSFSVSDSSYRDICSSNNVIRGTYSNEAMQIIREVTVGSQVLTFLDSCSFESALEIRFVLHPSVHLRQLDSDKSVILSRDDSSALLQIKFKSSIQSFDVERYSFSPAYGEADEAQVLIVQAIHNRIEWELLVL